MTSSAKDQSAGKDQIIGWLLEGDVSIQFQVHRDLLHAGRPRLRNRIAKEGWGAQFLSLRRADGHWGRGFYQPKWTSTHYTVLDLKNLGVSPDHEPMIETVKMILKEHKGEDGGVNPARSINQSDVCIGGMALNYACYFRMPEEMLQSIVDFLIAQQMGDGGFNCRSNRSGAVHSSLHSTISVLEGLLEYESGGYGYRLAELSQIAADSREFILQHRLFRSDHTGEIIDKRFLLLSYPSRWYYDILPRVGLFPLCRGRIRSEDAGCAGCPAQEAAKGWSLATPGETPRPDPF